MMAPTEPRTPPRFVPTLTEVVSVPEGLLQAYPSPANAGTSPPVVGAQAASPVPAPFEQDAWADAITHRVAGLLEQRLHALLEEHARLLSQAAAQQLADELPALVRQALRSAKPPEDLSGL